MKIFAREWELSEKEKDKEGGCRAPRHVTTVALLTISQAPFIRRKRGTSCYLATISRSGCTGRFTSFPWRTNVIVSSPIHSDLMLSLLKNSLYPPDVFTVYALATV